MNYKLIKYIKGRGSSGVMVLNIQEDKVISKDSLLFLKIEDLNEFLDKQESCVIVNCGSRRNHDHHCPSCRTSYVCDDLYCNMEQTEQVDYIKYCPRH